MIGKIFAKQAKIQVYTVDESGTCGLARCTAKS